MYEYTSEHYHENTLRKVIFDYPDVEQFTKVT